MEDDERVLTEAHITTLQAALHTLHARFRTLDGVTEDAEGAVEIEFKGTAAGGASRLKRAGARVMSGWGSPTSRPTAGRAQIHLDSIRVFKHRDMEPVYE